MTILTLEITGPQADKLGAAARKDFRGTGGTIGRLPGNDWALSDPYVSARHAVIRYSEGTFFIEDTSTNGVFVNSQNNRLVRGQPYTLKSGDWIFIEPYEIHASISSPVVATPSPLSDLFAPVSTEGPHDAPQPSPFDDPFAAPPPPAANWPRPQTSQPGADPFASLIPSDQVVDPLDLLGLAAPPAPAPAAPRAAALPPPSVLGEHYTPPPIIGPPPPSPAASAAVAAVDQPLIPADYNPLSSDDRSLTGSQPAPLTLPPPEPPQPTRRPTPSAADLPAPAAGPRKPTPGARPASRDSAILTPPSGRASAGAAPPAAAAAPVQDALPADLAAASRPSDLAAVLAGAGLPGVAVTPELADSFGRILHVVVAGVMDVLQARQRLKSEFRLGVTTFRPKDNNPLKFSANVDDALHNLLVKRNAAYLGPVEAFEDAFDDVRHHQIAILAGVRVAFAAMLAQFDPERLQEEFDRQ